tara:strand:- start:317 stop:1759 length:1443 start_codon:yes stop_codon:yes gene_type:complete
MVKKHYTYKNRQDIFTLSAQYTKLYKQPTIKYTKRCKCFLDAINYYNLNKNKLNTKQNFKAPINISLNKGLYKDDLESKKKTDKCSRDIVLSKFTPTKCLDKSTNTINYPLIIKKDISTSSTPFIGDNFFNKLFPIIIDKDNNINNIKKLEYTDQEKEYEFQLLDVDINNISDLIQLGKQYLTKYKPLKKKFNLNIRVLHDLVKPLEKLNSMIGMEKVKRGVFNKIIFYLQGLDCKNMDYNHVVLYGKPGVGKTELARIIGDIYCKMGLLTNGEFKEAKLTDLKAGFVGQSEIKTQKLLEESIGNVLFLDEAYSLGGSNDHKFDSYSQSIIDIINPFIEKYRDNFILIIAGYKDDLDKRFFRGNQGLKSRFGLFIEIDEYSPNDISQIFRKKIIDSGWKFIEEDISELFFKKNIKYFEFVGRDIEKFFSKCKIAHAKRVLLLDQSEKKIINKEDINSGFSIYMEEYCNNTDPDFTLSMYL